MTAQDIVRNEADVCLPKAALDITSRGIVVRQGDYFMVTVSRPPGQPATHRVWRDDAGRVRCCCLQYREYAGGTGFRCDHILAVKQSLLMSSSERVTPRDEEFKVVTAQPAAEAEDNYSRMSEEASAGDGSEFRFAALPVASVRCRGGWPDLSGRMKVVFPRNPLARTFADLVTPKQLGMIRAFGRATGMKPENECNRILGCNTDELSRAAASCFISHLQTIQREHFIADERCAS